MHTTRSGVSALTTSALFVALTAVCSWISVPLPGTSVPINLATFAVILTGTILGARRGAMAMVVFLLLGAVGTPIFSGFTGGVGIVLGPTGGFLVGYIALAAAAGISTAAAPTSTRRRILRYILAVLVGEVSLYALGVLWFILQSGADLRTAIFACVVPFLPGDAIKMILAYLVSTRLQRGLV